MIIYLSQQKDTLTAVTDRGYTPLMCAVSVGRLDLVELLISVGADPTFKTKDGKDALTVARHMANKSPQRPKIQNIVTYLESLISDNTKK
ncbi:ankyrin repeat domain-containing protein [Chlamydiia bacterium]|nr:ankyrin repeat domain-containing protein [Chlamydiia bacterium]